MDQKKTIVVSLGWKFAERISAQAITFVVSIIIARILEPSAYGLIAMVMVFISIANVLVSSGLGNALIQKQDADELDFSSVFFTQLAFSIILYMALFIAAPYAEMYYGVGYQGLSLVLRVVGLRIIISALNNVQHSVVARRMIFKKFFIATLFGTIISAFVGVFLAYAGYGVWALVFQYLTNTVVDTIVLSFTLDWHPSAVFSLSRLKPLLSYGWRLLFTDLINAFLNNVRTLIIGKAYSSEDLAFYNKGEQFPSVIVTNINSSLQSVLFPAMSNVQADLDKVKDILRKTISLGCFVIFPMTYGFLAVADSVVVLLLTEKWIECVPYVQFFCISYSLRIISTSCGQSIKAIGRSDIYMHSILIYKIIETVSIVIAALISVKAIAIGTIINAVIIVLIQFYYNNRYIGYSVSELTQDILPTVLLTVVMAIPVWFLNVFGNGISMLILRIMTGAFIYVFVAWLTNNKSLKSLLNLFKR